MILWELLLKKTVLMLEAEIRTQHPSQIARGSRLPK